MFDWLKNIFGGGNRSSNTSSRPATPRVDPAAEQRKREEEERRKREDAARKAREAEELRRINEVAAQRRQAEDDFNRRMQKMKPAEEKEKELNDLTKQNMDQSLKESRKGRDIFGVIADKMAGDADVKRAEVMARNRATSQYQDKYGWDNDKEVISFGNRTLEKADAGTKATRDSIDNTKKAVEVMRYVPGAGLGELGANALRGNFSGSKEADDTLLREQMDLNDAQIKALSAEDRAKYLAVSKGGLGAGVLDVVGLGAGSVAKSAAKGGLKQAIKQTAKSSIKEVAKDIATKQGAKTLVKNAAIGAGTGAAIGYGGAKVLGSDDKDALQAAVRGAGGGAFGGLASSPLDIAAVSLAKNKGAKNAVRGALEKGDATTVADAATKTAQRIASEDKPTIPDMQPTTPAATDPNKIEISPGVSVEQKQESPRGTQSAPIDNTPAFIRKREAEAQQAAVDSDVNAGVQEVSDVPAFQRQGRVLSSEESDVARAAELEASLKAMPTSDQLRSTEFELRRKFAKDVQARPDLRFQLQTQLTRNLDSLKRDIAYGDQAASELSVLQTKIGESQQQRKMAQALEAEQINAAPAMDAVDIPDPTNPIALAKGDETVAPVIDSVPIADFRNAEDGTAPANPTPLPNSEATPEVVPTTADVAQAAAQGDLRLPTRTQFDEGAPGVLPMQSDVQAAQQLADAGIAPPNRGDSPLALADEAEQAARAEAVQRQSSGQTDAPNTREAAVSRISDDEIRDDMMQGAPAKNTVSLQDAENSAKAFLNRMDDPQVVASFQTGTRVDDPTSFYTALNAVRRLERINTPEAQEGIRNAIDAMAEYAAESGRGLRTVQVLFDDMPAAMKVDYLTRRLSKAGADLTDEDRAQLAGFIQAADNATTNVRALEDRARQLLEDGSITNGNITPELQAQVRQLSDAIQKAELEKQAVSGEAFRDYQRHLDGEIPFGKRAGDVGRTLMLSAPSGRMFDLISTTATATDDLLTRGVSNLIGKGVNAVRGAGAVESTLPNAGQLINGIGEGLTRIKRGFQGDDFVEDFLGEAKRSTRGEINTGGGAFRRTVRTLVETPTNLTMGLRKDQLYRSAMQEAQKQGLTGDAASAYAQLRTMVPTSQQLEKATDTQMRANMLHENGASRMLNSLARQMDSNKVLGGWLAPLIRNQIAPFTSWLGGNLNRTFTDKNVLYNASHALVEAKRGNVQGVIDDVSKLAVNSAQAYAVGALLTQAGIITTTDANGDDYAGLYFHVGDRYIPVAAAGTVAVPIILGNAFQQAAEQAQEDGSGASAFANALVVNTLKNAGVASVFGGENNLQSTVSALAKGEVDVADTGVKFVGDFVRQYIPSLTGDVNSFLDMTTMNPTGEKASTKVLTADTEDNANKQDVLQTEIAKTLNRIPGASQSLSRDEGKLAQDPLDRILKGNHEGEASKLEKANTESLANIKKQYDKDGISTKAGDIEDLAKEGDYDKAIKGAKYRLAELEAKKDASEADKKAIRKQIEKYELEKDGVPLTGESTKARMEEGNYDKVVKGLEYKYKEIENDKDTAQSTKDEMKNQIAKLKVYSAAKLPPQIVRAYESSKEADGGVGVTAWREMMGSGDQNLIDQANKLADLDKKLLDAGLIKEAKYYWKGGRRGGSGGGGGGRGGSAPKFSTDIAMNDINFTVQKLQKGDAEYKTPKSSIPTIQSVKNYDTSRLKKVKVSKGVAR